MKSNTSKLVLAIIVIVVVLGGGYAILHKPKTTPAATTSSSSNTASGSSGQPASPTSGSIVQTKTTSSGSQYLADANGNALYTYGGDTTGVSNCSGSCIASWPVYQATSSSTSLPANVTVITRSDGSKQYAYKGLPLYTFSGDSVGQATGDGVSNFHLTKP